MTEKITYYAIVDESQQPGSTCRRCFAVSRMTKVKIDEMFSRNLKWEFSPLLYSAERGDLANDFVPIGEDEAERIVARIRGLAASEE